MRRRDLIATVIGMSAVWPLKASPQRANAARIGVLVLGNNDPESFLRDLRSALVALGRVDGENIFIDFRSAGGNEARLADLAAELVRAEVQVIVAWQTPPAKAAKQATSHVPIVIWSGDPVGAGLVDSLSRPGGNITGVSTAGTEITGKRVELAQELLPSTRRIAALANATDPFAPFFVSQVAVAASALGLGYQTVMVRPEEDLVAAFDELHRTGADAVFIQGSILRQQAVDLALKHRMLSIGDYRLLPALGGLLSYGPNFADTCREIATFVDKILRGRRPADLPVQLPTRFDLVLNLKTARALGLSVPASFLARVDEVIE